MYITQWRMCNRWILLNDSMCYWLHDKLFWSVVSFSFVVSSKLCKVKDIHNFRWIYPNSRALQECSLLAQCSPCVRTAYGVSYLQYDRNYHLSGEMFLFKIKGLDFAEPTSVYCHITVHLPGLNLQSKYFYNLLHLLKLVTYVLQSF